MMRRPPEETATADTLSQLEVGERLFVWGFRSVAQYRRIGRPSMTELQRVCDHFGVVDAVPSLDAMLETFACTAHTVIELHCPGCPCLSESEYLLLQAAAACQHGDTITGQRRFEFWLPEVAADWILAPACGLGRIFANSGLILRSRNTSFMPRGGTMALQTWPVGSSTLH